MPAGASSAAATSHGTTRGSRSTTLEELRVALGDARVARHLRRDLEHLEPPLRLGEEPHVLPLQLDVLERADHRLTEVGALPRLHEYR